MSDADVTPERLDTGVVSVISVTCKIQTPSQMLQNAVQTSNKTLHPKLR